MTGSCRNDWMDVRAATWEAISTKALAPADSGREMTTGVPLSASSRVRAEERHAQPLRRRLGAAVAEDLMAVPAARADVPAHVLDEAKWRHVEPPEHLQRLDRDVGRDVLRGADDGDPGEGDGLRPRQGRGVGAGPTGD